MKELMIKRRDRDADAAALQSYLFDMAVTFVDGLGGTFKVTANNHGEAMSLAVYKIVEDKVFEIPPEGFVLIARDATGKVEQIDVTPQSAAGHHATWKRVAGA